MFYCTSRARLPALVRRGATGVLLWRTLADARRICDADEVILVVEHKDTGLRNLRWAPCAYLERVLPEEFQNAAPYLPPREVLAAGGVVLRAGVVPWEILQIRRHGQWDLPKGKCDGGESLRACALREVREETGANDLALGRCLGATVHGYPQGKSYRVKRTYWYEMHSACEVFSPQAEEGITAVEWVRWDPAKTRLAYQTLRHLSGTLAERLSAR